MSIEHQKYSTENQADAIKRYAAARGYQIVPTYSDAGKSGLPGFGLKRMRVGEPGKQKGPLEQDEHKSIQINRVTLVSGPHAEIALVNQFFEAG